MNDISGNDRTALSVRICIFIPQSLREPEGSPCILSSQIQKFFSAIVGKTASRIFHAIFQFRNIVRIFLCVLVIEQGVSRKVNLSEHVDSLAFTYILQRSPLFFRIRRVSLIVFVIFIIICINEVRRHPGMFYL